MGEDEPSGLNGRLRPRKSSSFSPQTKPKNKSEGKILPDKSKKTSAPSKVSLSKQDDYTDKSEFTLPPHFLCPYCDKNFASKQAVSKHSRRMHFSSNKQDAFLGCLFCNHTEADSNIIGHMVDSHPNQYFACLECHTRFPSTSELAEHKLNVCEKQRVPYRTKLRQKGNNTKKIKKVLNIDDKDFHKDDKDFQEGHGFNGIVISCELKPSQVHDEADIEDNITTNLILPSSKNLGTGGTFDKNAVIVLDDIQQWNKRIPSNFSFHNSDADQILSRLGVVQRTTRTGESTRKDWMKAIEESTQKFERCFDTKFYSKVASNVQENLAKFLDGSFNFNPDPDSTIKTRKSKNSVVINTAEGFPILLASEQYSRSVFDSYMPRAIAPKHKWKWDNLENDKSPDQIKRDTHANNCIITLVSSLDIWTQLCMRQKFEAKFNTLPVEKKTEKQNILSKELKEILESREIPTTSDVMKYCNKPMATRDAPDFPASLGLVPSVPTYEVRPAVLSGEWVRPRCYVCCACGEQTTDSKGLSAHISTQHPNAQVQYYEIVGEPLLNADILKHLYVPPSQVSNRTRPPRGFRECTKCRKSITLDDLHQHMLDCAGDTPTVRRRQCRYRPFGVRRRRPRLPDNTLRKKMRKDAIRSQQRRPKTLMRPRPRIRSEVGDAETIRKMLADLPAKRHRVLVNPMNMMQRPRKNLDRQRNKLIMRKSSSDDVKFRKRRLNRGDNNGRNVHNDDVNKNSSGMEDDEDNKPLKPKLKSMIGRITRQRESLKRQTMINRAKRKSIRVEQRRNIDNICRDGPSSSGTIQDTSIDVTPRKVDVKRAAFNTREHGNSGTSGSRDDQRPGCSRTNSSANNSTAPTQHAPLKHSIARLTADSERHDKSVQFHSLFLVQQECNNTNQHVPTGQLTLFENEAAVTRLDKPPLTHCPKGAIDSQNNQKNKLNKPRKGLNDCIAMLKNKLVEPVVNDAPSHVSVLCGSDEPIDSDIHPMVQGVSTKFSAIGVNTAPEICHKVVKIAVDHTQGSAKSMANLVDHQNETKQLAKHSTILEPAVPIVESGFQNIDTNPTNVKTIKVGSPKLGETGCNHESATAKHSRRGSSLLTTDIYIEPLKSHGTDHVANDLKPQPKVYAQESRVVQKTSPELSKQYNINTEQINQRKQYAEQVNERKQHTEHVNERKQHTEHVNERKQHTEQINERKQHTEQINERKQHSELVNERKQHTEHVNERKQHTEHVNERKQHTEHVNERKQHTDHVNERKQHTEQVNERKQHSEHVNERKQHTDHVNERKQHTEHVNERKQHNVRSPNEIPSLVSDMYLEDKTIEIPPNIPPAHASTNIESIISTPLDLSSKVVGNGKAKSFQNSDNFYIANYTSYETLDLSNKGRMSQDAPIEDDIIVDLRIKPSQLRETTQSETLDLCVKSNKTTEQIDRASNMTVIDQFPTDLSIKGKQASGMDADKKSREVSTRHQPLLNNKLIEAKQLNMAKEKNTDLSGKSTNGKCNVSPSIPQNYIISKEISDSNLRSNVSIATTQISGDGDKKRKNLQVQSMDALDIPLKNVTEFKKVPEKSSKNSDIRLINDRSLLLQKPIYDPTLKIPQYKIRANNAFATESPSAVSLDDAVDVTSMELITDMSLANIATTPKISHDSILSQSLAKNNNLEFNKNNIISGSIGSHVFPSHSGTSSAHKIESTTPVYTLANACITITKIESSCSNTLTNTLLSIPGSTIASTAPVYTLTGTTIASPSKYTSIPDSDLHSNAVTVSNYPTPVTNAQTDSAFTSDNVLYSVKNNRDVRSEITKKSSLVIDQDPDTARKIAMLPKELVEILGNMPVDHRNQLLNVLPQYVSTSATSIPLYAEEPEKETLRSVDPRTVNNVSEPPTLESNTVPSTSTNLANTNLTNQIDEGTKEDQKQLFNISISAPLIVPKENTKAEKLEISTVGKLDNQPVNSPRVEKIIDLTQDESIPLNINIDKVDVPLSAGFTVQENSGNGVSNVMKLKSDKTASLRAVRIKAPSERQKESQMLKRSVEKNIESEENEVHKHRSEANKSLAIQQAEVSSTQHTNKAVTVGTKYSVENLSNDLEPSLKIHRASGDEILEKDKKSVIDCPTTKSSLVTSSVPINNPKIGNVSDISDVDVHQDSIKDCFVKSESLSVAKIQEDDKGKSPNENTKEIKAYEDNEAAKISKLVSMVEEEDSEDDIILAAIVKQKQNAAKKCNLKEIEDPLRDKQSITNKKRKKSKKNISQEKDAKLTNVTNNAVETYKYENNTSVMVRKLIPCESTSDTNEQQSKDDIDSIEVTQTKSKTIVDNNNVLGNETSNNGESGNHKQIKTDVSNTHHKMVKMTAEDINQTECRNNITTVTLSNNVGEPVLKQIKSIKSKDKLKKKRKQPDVNEDKKVKELTSHTNTNISKKSNITDNQSSINREIQEIVYENQKQEPDKKKCKTIEQAKTLKEIDETENILRDESAEMSVSEDSIGTPLRRSRRGKSLLSDTPVSEPEILNVDVVIDPKMPLTKKQLIFSKLLLDEENNLSKRCNSEIDIPSSDAMDKLSTATSEVQLEKDIDILAINTSEKSKSVKRKKNQLKRKNKKQKSIEQYTTSTITEDSDNKEIDDFNQAKINEVGDPRIDTKELQESSKICLDKDEGIFKEKNNLDEIPSTSSTINEAANNVIIDNTDNIGENKFSHTEKRKITNATPNLELSQICKPKKLKFDTENNEKEDTVMKDSPDHLSTDKRPTTCYNLPLAARRTRSKSVGVTSSTQFYDPYDIDLEDMDKKLEAPRKLENKIKTKISKLSEQVQLSADLDSSESHNNIKKERKKSSTFQLGCGISKNVVKVPSDIKTYNQDDSNDNSELDDQVYNLRRSPEKNMTMADSSSKDNVCDSDESSKSDVPLKKYVEDRMRMSEQNIEKIPDTAIVVETNQNKHSTKKRNANKYDKNSRTSDVANDDANDVDAAEEQLRSEQFMESFGFFSERKPRKSNLLATKKISETFHIIANEDDMFYKNSKERSSKKSSQSEPKKSPEDKKNIKRGRKKKEIVPEIPEVTICYCELCKREFRRHDNYVRHQLSLPHVAKVAEFEMKIKVEPLHEETNYLIIYKQHIDRLKLMNKGKKNSKTKFVLPTFEDILADLTNAEEERARQGLSRDEALFLDCCELLKESHKTELLNPDAPALNLEANAVAGVNNLEHVAPGSSAELDYINKNIEKSDSRSDGDVDSITAKNILESEEVRNLENDLISGLKEAANMASASKNKDYIHSSCTMMHPHEVSAQSFSNLDFVEQPHSSHMEVPDLSYTVPVESAELIKNRKQPEFKDKMYPDIEEIDMFEDKFDKIKRKCRSQAAAAKQAQAVKPEMGHKEKKKSDKKKGKKSSKKNYQNTILTKGALKGFDGIKVSIPTSDINMAGIVLTHENTTKKKKKAGYKKKREKKDSETSSRYDSDNRFKDPNLSQKKVDVYEFMDNEDAELFEFRPSTLMERFKSISNKDTPSTSKYDATAEDFDNSSGSASDGDDFVYMSDDYVCSDDETENSLLSSELGNVKTETKKTPPLKRKDATEKSAVMGKIFKHNAVRSEKKIKNKDIAKPKANLDQLFDSLLEEEPTSSLLNNDSNSPIRDDFDTTNSQSSLSPKYDETESYVSSSPSRDCKSCKKRTASISPERYSAVKPNLISKHDKFQQDYKISSTIYEGHRRFDFSLPSSKKDLSTYDYYGPSTSKRYEEFISKEYKTSSPKKHDNASTKKYDKIDTSPVYRTSPLLADKFDLKGKDKSVTKSIEETYCDLLYDEDAGVARQRARRKCTVGKQNVLAETWSSESEPDGLPPRSNSAESVVASAGRKKKGKKRDGHQSFGRRKKQDESRPNRTSTSNVGVTSVTSTRAVGDLSERSTVGSHGAQKSFEERSPSDSGMAGPQGTAADGVAHTSKVRPRSTAYYWSSEGDDEQEHMQQHGWIVGDSHKKLVTMLAHAKGRKRNNDDKRNLVE